MPQASDVHQPLSVPGKERKQGLEYFLRFFVPRLEVASKNEIKGLSPKELENEMHLSLEDDIVSHTTSDGASHELEALEFPARLTSHYPHRFECFTRHYGYYSCRTRGGRKKAAYLKAIHGLAVPLKPPAETS